MPRIWERLSSASTGREPFRDCAVTERRARSGAIQAPGLVTSAKLQEFTLLFKTFALAATIAGTAALGACSIGSDRPKGVVASWGHSQRAHQALMTKFNRSAFKAGDYVWTKKKLPKGSTEVVINIPRQIAYVYHAGDLVAASSVSTGMPGKDTPTGRFPIMEKKRDHKSNRYSNAPMPYMQRLTNFGIALHGGELPGYPASHGCIRLPMGFAQKLYALTDLDDMVYVEL